jgi:3-oxoacyl-[acyl-carrier protein] reductase
LDVKGRVALVTGGSQGIGAATARLLGQEGATVAITYRQQAGKAAEVVRDVEAAGGTALAVPMDLGDPASVRAAVDAALDRFGQVDILVNNAVQWAAVALADPRPFESVPVAEWQAGFRSNAEGPYAAIQAVLPSMRARGWGRIVNVSSGIAADGVPGGGTYGAAKAALHGLTKTLAKELGPAGILVNVVMPGPTLTERIAGHLPSAARELRERRTPIGRLLGPAEVVPVIAFLCSGANVAVTGEIIRASGGHTS